MEHKVIEKELPKKLTFKDAASIPRNWFLQLIKQQQLAVGKAKIKKVREGLRSLGNISKFPMRSPCQQAINKIVELNYADITTTVKATKNSTLNNNTTQRKIISITSTNQNISSAFDETDPWKNLEVDYLVVIDTNVLILSLQNILALIDFQLPYQNGKPLNGIVYCPEVVFEEMDKFKSNSANDPDRAFRARQAINTIEKHLGNNPRFHGQSKSEQYFASKIPNFLRKTNDDEILQTCLYLKREHQNTKVHLLSYDHNLRNRAHCNGIEISPITKEWESMSRLTTKKTVMAYPPHIIQSVPHYNYNPNYNHNYDHNYNHDYNYRQHPIFPVVFQVAPCNPHLAHGTRPVNYYAFSNQTTPTGAIFYQFLI